MRKYLCFLLFISSLFGIFQGVQSQNKVGEEYFIDLSGTQVSLDKKKTTLVVAFSPQSCHQCYVRLSDVLDTLGLWERADLDIVAIVSGSESAFDGVRSRKFYYNYIKKVMPPMPSVFYNLENQSESGMATLFGETMETKYFPVLFVIKEGGSKLYKHISLRTAATRPEIVEVLRGL